MNSLWKDLLFLHGHLVRKEDLVWRSDTAPGQHTTDLTTPLPQAMLERQPRDCGTPACA